MIKQAFYKTTEILSLKKLLFWGSIVAITVLVAHNTKDAIFGTTLSVREIKDGTTVTTAFMPLHGSARHASELRINGREVAFDRSGAFSDGVLLSPGYNILDIAVTDKFGKHSTKSYRIVLEEPPAVASVSITNPTIK